MLKRKSSRSTVGRTSDRTAAVRGQSSNPGAGNLVIFGFLVLFFLPADNTSLMYSYTDTHIIYHRIDCPLFLKMWSRCDASEQKYRKISVTSPGLIQLRKGFIGWAYKRRGLYPRWRNKKKRFEMSHSSVDGNTFTNFWLNFQASLYVECNSILGTKSKLTT